MLISTPDGLPRSIDVSKSQRLSVSDFNYDLDRDFLFYVYRGLSVSNQNGTVLIDFPRSQKIRAFVGPSIYWHTSRNDNGQAITSPFGSNNISGQFPGRNLYSIVLFQPTGKVVPISTTTPPTPDKTIDVVKDFDLYFAVNDIAPDGYADNAGSYDLYIARSYP